MDAMSVAESAAGQIEAGITESESRRHLEMLLASTAFSKTKRHARFLRFVVDKTFAGQADEIKERTLGIEIFDRQPSYDLSDDPIVRVTAGDIRKRLQQYYREEGEQEGIRLELPTGSYVPVFRPRQVVKELAPAPAIPLRVDVPTEPVPELHKSFRSGLATLIAMSAVLLIVLVCWTTWHEPSRAERDLHRFWEPLESGQNNVIGIVVGDLNALNHTMSSAAEQTAFPLGSRAITGAGDTYALAAMSDQMGADHEQVRAYMADNVNLSDLRAQPSVLIGAYDNPWAARMLEGERFSMEASSGSNLSGIRDSAHPGATQWIRDALLNNSNGQDFALVTRKRSALTGQMFVSVCGIGTYGTVAAAEFLTHPEYFEQFARTAPSGWQDKDDLQIVLAVNIVDGRTSPPTVLAYALK
jgi:hypothetical protein